MKWYDTANIMYILFWKNLCLKINVSWFVFLVLYVNIYQFSVFGAASERSSGRDSILNQHNHNINNRFRSSAVESKLEEILSRDRFFARNNQRTSFKPSHLYGHPLFRSSHGDLSGRGHGGQGHRHNLQRFASQRDLTARGGEFHVSGGVSHTVVNGHTGRPVTRSDPARSSRHRHQHTEGTRSREILATISPRRLPSSASGRGVDGCNRCHISSGLWENAAFHY